MKSKHKWVSLVILAIVAIVVITTSRQIFETNKAGNLQVKQAAIKGTLTCRLEPGMYGQMFGDIHTYKEAETFYFTADKETGERKNQALPTRFNDGAKAQVSGSLRVILPQNCEQLVKIHRKFRNMQYVMDKLVLPAVRKALFSTGPHMSAGESYAERRGEFASLAEDQLHDGVIRVDKHKIKRPDPITGEIKEIWVLNKISCSNESVKCIGGYLRDVSAFTEFGISITNFVIDGIQYPKAVLAQIETQRSARMNVITQQAQAREAEARASKADAEALAKVAETRAIEEVRKTEITVRAEAQREKARLAMEAAVFTKKEQILLGEGEARRKELVITADGALAQKLEALVTINKNYADAYAHRQVPKMIFGSGGNGGREGTITNTDTSTMDFINIMKVYTAKELAVDMNIMKKK